jgi:hypothetical protein
MNKLVATCLVLCACDAAVVDTQAADPAAASADYRPDPYEIDFVDNLPPTADAEDQERVGRARRYVYFLDHQIDRWLVDGAESGDGANSGKLQQEKLQGVPAELLRTVKSRHNDPGWNFKVFTGLKEDRHRFYVVTASRTERDSLDVKAYLADGDGKHLLWANMKYHRYKRDQHSHSWSRYEDGTCEVVYWQHWDRNWDRNEIRADHAQYPPRVPERERPPGSAR